MGGSGTDTRSAPGRTLFSQIGTKTPGHGIYRGLLELRPGSVAVVGRGGT
ncbi:MAG TPA: hypothetical protein VHT26_11090 [Trebonia sp.]|nr:hypothetical protein [Trebonia sp.]